MTSNTTTDFMQRLHRAIQIMKFQFREFERRGKIPSACHLYMKQNLRKKSTI